MALYTVDVRNGVAQRVTEGYDRRDNPHRILIEAGSAKQAWAKASRSSASGSGDCDWCRHRYCSDVKNAPSQNDTRTTGSVTAAGN